MESVGVGYCHLVDGLFFSWLRAVPSTSLALEGRLCCFVCLRACLSSGVGRSLTIGF